MLIIAMAIPMDHAFADSKKVHSQDSTYNFFPKKKSRKNILTFTLPPIKAGVTSSVHLSVPKPDDKLLSGVEVYPNPITDQINLKYVISRNSNVTIKMVDVLGNNILTLFSQRVDPGERTFTYAISNKLNKGFYFIRVVAGTESVIKRISIL
jgi:hypothetical protein